MVEDVVELSAELKLQPMAVNAKRSCFHCGKVQRVERRAKQGVPRPTEVKNVLEELDGWLRYKPRTLLWRQRKRVYSRARNPMQAGIDQVRACEAPPFHHGPRPLVNQAYPKNWFDRLGLVSLLDTQRTFQSVHELPDAERHVRVVWEDGGSSLLPDH